MADYVQDCCLNLQWSLCHAGGQARALSRHYCSAAPGAAGYVAEVMPAVILTSSPNIPSLIHGASLLCHFVSIAHCHGHVLESMESHWVADEKEMTKDITVRYIADHLLHNLGELPSQSIHCEISTHWLGFFAGLACKFTQNWHSIRCTLEAQ